MRTTERDPATAFEPGEDLQLMQLIDEITRQLEAGQPFDLDAFVADHPTHGQELRRLLPAIEAMMRLSGDDDPATPSVLSRTLGDFRIIGELGRGGMGVVYEAEQISLHRRVALKVLPFAAVMDQRQLVRFKNEAQAAAVLQHQNIVPVYSVGCERGVHYYAMQYIEGQSLAEVIQQLRRLEEGAKGNEQSAEPSGVADVASELSLGESPPTKRAPDDVQLAPSQTTASAYQSSHATRDTVALAGLTTDRSSKSPAYFRGVSELGIQAAEALEHAHTNDVLHRDIKPANLLLDVSGNLWITDFGLARVGIDPGLTLSGDLLGTLRYISPEQAMGRRVVVDRRTDVYSLGVTLYELLTLRPAYEGDDRHQLLRKIAFGEPRPPRRINKSIPAELETIVLKAMSKSPAERYATARELADDLERFLADKTIKARRPNVLQRATKWSRRHKPLVWSVSAAAAIVLLTIAAALGVIAKRERSGRMEAERAKNQISRQLAEGYLHRAQGLCESGDVAQGMLWMARSLERTPADASDLQSAIRRNLAAWSRQLHPLVTIFEHDGGIRKLAFTPDGSRLLIATSDHGTAQLWDPVMGIPIGPPLQHRDEVQSVRMSPDGLRVLTGSSDWTAQLWDPYTGKPIGEPLMHEHELRAVLFSPDGLSILTGSYDGIARVWEADTGKLIAFTQERHKRGVPVVAFSPDGTNIVTGSSDGTARVWLAATGEAVTDWLECKGWVKAVHFSQDGSQFMTLSSDGSTRLWDTETGELVGQPFNKGGLVAYAAISPDGSRYLLGSSSATARLWEVTTATALCQPLRHSGFRIWNVAFRPDGSGFVTGSRDEVRVWASNVGFSVGPPMMHRDGESISAVAFSADGSRMLTGSWVGSVQLWDRATGKPLGEPLDVGAVQAVSSDGARILTRRDSRTAQVWDVAKGIPVGKPLQHPSDIYSAAFSRDGSRVLIGCSNRTTHVWDADTGLPSREPLLYPGDWAISNPVAFSPDGLRLLTGQRLALELWDAVTGNAVGEPLEQQDRVYAVAFSPDGSRILTGLMDGTAWVWDLSTGKRVHGPLEHEANVMAVAYSPDGATLLTGSLDATARFWDAATGKPIGPPLRHEAGVAAVAFSPDGSHVLTGCQNGTARLWSAPPAALESKLNQTVLWTQVITGLELDESSDAVHVLDSSSWRTSRDLLEKLGGPPSGALETVRPKPAPSAYDPSAWHRLMAHHRSQEKKWTEAVRHLDALLSTEPQNWWDLISRGRAYAELGQWRKANEDYEKATRLAPHNWNVWLRLAQTQLAVDDLDGYRNTCRTLLERLGQTKGRLVGRGITFTFTLATGAVDDFERPLKLAVAVRSNGKDGFRDRAVSDALLYRAGRFEDAIQKLTEQIDAYQHMSPAYSSFAYSSYFLAMAYKQMGDAEEARSWLDKARRSTEQFAGKYDDDPWHSLALRLLRREAEELLEQGAMRDDG